MSLIFIAIPTKGTVVNGQLSPTFLKALADLHFKHPEHTFIAPMVQDYQLLAHMPQVTATWEDWGKHCRLLIERSDEVWVMMFRGWAEPVTYMTIDNTSVGVKGEIDHALTHFKKVRFIDPFTLEEA